MSSEMPEPFSVYLESLNEELLGMVAEDYIWLSSLDFPPEAVFEFARRRECCRAECARRGLEHLYRTAENAIRKPAA